MSEPAMSPAQPEDTIEQRLGEIRYSDVISAQLVDHMGGDIAVCRSARVSTLGDQSLSSGKNQGLIKFLMKNRHGSPFEHGSFTWLVHAPTVVYWQLVRHRMASYNIESGRYRVLQPEFYLPPRERKLVQVGKPGAYGFVEGSDVQYEAVIEHLKLMAETWWCGYRHLGEIGIANEVARLGLPFHLYWSGYVTMNPRALMNFLSLRSSPSDSATVPSFPQAEIATLARCFEDDFIQRMPMTWHAFNENGRVAP